MEEQGSKGVGEQGSKTQAALLVHLSQGHLTLLSICPRKFQYAVLEQLSLPSSPEQQERQEQGARFHLVLQQWQLELPIAPFLQEDLQLGQWFSAFQSAAPTILAINDSETDSAELERWVESDRTLEWAGYLLTARYDLLLTSSQQAKILDWKTYAKPKRDRELAHSWQTRLYLFLLTETSAYDPEQLSMVYWFFQTNQPTAESSPEPQSLRIPYSRTQHEQTRQELTHLLSQLTQQLTDYHQDQPLPQWGIANQHCPDCSFLPRCFGTSTTFDAYPSLSQDTSSPSLPNLADIQEIPL